MIIIVRYFYSREEAARGGIRDFTFKRKTTRNRADSEDRRRLDVNYHDIMIGFSLFFNA